MSGNSEGAAKRDSAEQNPESGQPQPAQQAQPQQAAYVAPSGGPTHFPQGFDAGQSGQGAPVGGAPGSQPAGAAPGTPSLEGGSLNFPGSNRAAGDFFKKRSSIDILATAVIAISFFAPWGDKAPLLLLAFVAAIAGSSSS